MVIKHLIKSQQIDDSFLEEVFSRVDWFKKERSNSLNGKIVASLFYEPSTRTRLSFESAVLRLGGDVIGTENASEFSSAVKGESLEDTIRIVSNYSDAIVLRHKEEGSAERAASVSRVPIINAGDGTGQHPTQAILDMYTIRDELGTTDDLKIAMVGDLLSGRTVRSLCYLLGRNYGNEITFVSPKNLRMGRDILEYLDEHDVKYFEESDLNPILSDMDVVYMTRIQKERISEEDYLEAKGKFVISRDNLGLVKKDSRIMHPLPHVEEIDLPIEVEQNDLRVAYFRQAENGLYIRMAILDLMLS